MSSRRASENRPHQQLAEAKRLGRKADRQALATGSATRDQLQCENRFIDGTKVRIDYARVRMPR
ncbi:MAG: hypothetical protein R3B13_29405 [Polyangiaceae bacterium]